LIARAPRAPSKPYMKGWGADGAEDMWFEPPKRHENRWPSFRRMPESNVRGAVGSGMHRNDLPEAPSIQQAFPWRLGVLAVQLRFSWRPRRLGGSNKALVAPCRFK